jgi:hypothetical protein
MVMINLLLVRSCLHLGVEQRTRFSTSRAQETFERKIPTGLVEIVNRQATQG